MAHCRASSKACGLWLMVNSVLNMDDKHQHELITSSLRIIAHRFELMESIPGWKEAKVSLTQVMDITLQDAESAVVQAIQLLEASENG